MTESRNLGWSLIGLCLLFVPAQAFGLSAEEMMEKAIENIKGPSGMMLVSEGHMRFSWRNLRIRIARCFSNGTEGFQIDILSPVEDQEVPGASPQTNKKYRVVRKGTRISTLAYLPSLRRGRQINYVPTDGILGSDYPYYLLPLVSDFIYDFSYAYVKEDPNTPIIEGLKKEESNSPYSRVEIHLQKIGGTFTIEKAIYEAANNKGFSLISQDFKEFTEGYWAPEKIRVKNTTFTFNVWKAREPVKWIMSTNHNRFDAQSIPRP